VANAVLVGTFIQLLTSIDGISRLGSDPLDVRIGLLAAGIALVGPASAFYIGADPRDTLMLVGALRTHRRVGVVRAALEVTALAAGIVLGGTFGVGTVAFALLVGPVVQTSFAQLARSPLAQSAPVPVVHGVHEDDREPGDGGNPALALGRGRACGADADA